MLSTVKEFEEAFARLDGNNAEEIERLAVAFESRKEYLPVYQQAQFAKKLAQLRKREEVSVPAITSFAVAPKEKVSAPNAMPKVANVTQITENGSFVFDGLTDDLSLPDIPVANLTFRNLHRLTVRCSPCLGSLYLEECSQLELYGAAHQVRCSRVSNSKLHLFSATPVALEDCEGVEVIAETACALPAKLQAFPNRASEIIDFSLN